MLDVIDELTYECLAIRVARKLKAIDVIDVLSDLFILRGVPGHIRSDHGPEFAAKAVQEWITAVGAKTAYIPLGTPGITDTSRASTHACSMNCLTVKSLARCAKLRSSSKAGNFMLTRSGRMNRSATNRLHRECACLHSPHGRLRYARSASPATLQL
jgi:transposase InsO family protein